VRLLVLGRNGPFPAPGEACSGYFLEEEGFGLLVECGNGVLSRLQLHLPLDGLQAVVLSHLHPDHLSDLFILRYALEGERRREKRAGPLPVWAPPEPEEEFRRLSYKDIYEIRPYRPGDSFEVGPFRVLSAPARHFIPAAALRVEGGGRALAFSSDTGPSFTVSELARGADLFLCEANLLEGESEGHLNGYQAGELAREAGARRLLLTHFYPGTPLRELALRAGEAFGAPVELAEEGKWYEI